jgi:hypothetical protein
MPSSTAGSSWLSIQLRPRCRARNSETSEAIHVGTCTPLVMTDRSSGARSGHIGAHIVRVTSPCSLLTALTSPAERARARSC